MATLIQVTSFNGVNVTSANDPTGTATQPVFIDRDNIVAIQTRTSAYATTGVTNILYNLPVNNSNVLITLVVTQTAQAVATAANSTVGSMSAGRATLVAGTVTVTIPGLTAANNVVVSMLTPGNTANTTEYQGVASTDAITIRANVAAGTINTADTSTLVYAVVS